MNNKRFISVLIVFIAAACAPGDRQEAEVRPADLVFRNGNIYTVDAQRSWADTVAITGKAISYVGAPRRHRSHENEPGIPGHLTSRRHFSGPLARPSAFRVYRLCASRAQAGQPYNFPSHFTFATTPNSRKRGRSSGCMSCKCEM